MGRLVVGGCVFCVNWILVDILDVMFVVLQVVYIFGCCFGGQIVLGFDDVVQVGIDIVGYVCGIVVDIEMFVFFQCCEQCMVVFFYVVLYIDFVCLIV